LERLYLFGEGEEVLVFVGDEFFDIFGEVHILLDIERDGILELFNLIGFEVEKVLFL
jgi:hypothetical protein